MSHSARSRRTAAARPAVALVAIASVLVALFTLAGTAFAGHATSKVTPTAHGNSTCGALLGSGSWSEIKREGPGGNEFPPGTYSANDGTVSISFTIDANALLDFTMQTDGYVVVAAFPFGGPPGEGYLYDYRPLGGVISDVDLHAKEAGGGYAEISHVSFCYGVAPAVETTPPTDGDGTTPPTTPPTDGNGTTPPDGTTPTPTGGELGGRGTPQAGTGGELGGRGTPEVGTIPDTSAEVVTLGQLVTVLSVLLVVGSLAALVAPVVGRRWTR